MTGLSVQPLHQKIQRSPGHATRRASIQSAFFAAFAFVIQAGIVAARPLPAGAIGADRDI